jgi:hypothetical protein
MGPMTSPRSLLIGTIAFFLFIVLVVAIETLGRQGGAALSDWLAQVLP